MDLDELRKKFWWLGGHGEHILNLEDDVATVAVPRHTWNPIPAYEARLAAMFGAAGIKVQSKDAFLAELEKIIRDRADLLHAKGVRMDRERFIARMKRREELAADRSHRIREKKRDRKKRQ